MALRSKYAERHYTDFRQCGDYKPLHLESSLDRYPLPGIEDIFNQMEGTTIFSKFNLMSGFHKMPRRMEDSCKTTFWGSNIILWDWLVLPFGLKNAPPCFQRRMDHALHDLLFCRCYVDDIVILSRSLKDIIQDIWNKCSSGCSRRVKRSSRQLCVWGRQQKIPWSSNICQHIRAPAGEASSGERPPSPKNIYSLRSALELFSYYRKLVLNFDAITSNQRASEERQSLGVGREASNDIFGAQGATL